MLRHENQPGAGRRAQAVRERAEGAGWPSLHVGISATRAAVSESVRELEDTDWRWTERASRAWLWETPAFPSALICGDE
jgi:hypothetical protein